MISTTWTAAPADLLGLGSAAVRPCNGLDVAVSAAPRAPMTSVIGTGLPFVGIAVRPRPGFAQDGTDVRAEVQTTAVVHNSIAVRQDGTPLGIHPSRRPQS